MVGIVVLIVSMLVFFRFQIANGFTLFFGDRYDAMIEISILQHWVNVFHGTEYWNETRYFYPASDTLGYNDPYFLYGAMYGLARALGFPLVAAAEIVHGAMKVLGFLGMVWLLRSMGRCRFGWCLFGAALFTVSDLTLQHANHGQLFTLAFAPYALLFAARAVTALLAEDRRSLVRSGGAFLAIYALWISTAYYLAWFFSLYAMIVAVVLLVRAGTAQRLRAMGAAKRCLPQILMLMTAGMLLLAPFLAVYLPKRAETGMHSYAEASVNTFTTFDYFNVTGTNMVWGGMMDMVRGTIAQGLAANHDQIFGITPVLLGLAIFSAVRFRRQEDEAALGALGIAMLISWLLMMRLAGFSAWQFVYAWMPGAAGVRVVGRFDLLLLVPAVVLGTTLLDRSRKRGIAFIIAACLLAEEANTAAPVRLDQADQLAMLADVSALPPACESFYVASSRRHAYAVVDPINDHLYAHNVDAMLLAEELGRPTVNGYSTFEPPHWDFDHATRADYEARVRRYARATGIAMPCRLDMLHGGSWGYAGH